MTDWSERLRKRLDDLKMTPADLVRASGVSRDLIYKYVDGKVAHPRGDILDRIARSIGISEAELRYGIQTTISTRRIPLLTMNKLGTIRDISEISNIWDGVSVIVAGELGDGAFAVTLSDEACAPDFPSGSVIVCDPEQSATPGRYVVAIVSGVGAVVRRFRQREAGKGDFWLIADNPDFPDIHATSPGAVVILGRAVKHIRDI